jgi:hypothetical protein
MQPTVAENSDFGWGSASEVRMKYDSRSFWEGPDFSRAAKSMKMCPRFSA